MIVGSNQHVNTPAVVQPADDLAALASAINSEHAAVARALASGVKHARSAGELLLKAKQECGHGEWLPWLETNCPDIGPRQCQKYMRLARQLPANTNCDSHLSIEDTLAAIGPRKSDVMWAAAEPWRDDCPRKANLCEVVALLSDALDEIRDDDPDALFHLKQISDLATEAETVAATLKLEAMTELGKLLLAEKQGGVA